MRVLITVPDLALDSGGPSLSSTRSADALNALGFDTAIACAASQCQELRPENPRVGIMRLNGNSLAYARALLATARDFAPDIIYDFGVWTTSNVASAWVARRLGIPWIVSPRGMLEPWSLASKRRKKQIAWPLYQRPLLRGAAALIATSGEERSNLLRLLPEARVVVAPNGVDLPELALAARQRQALFLSRLHPKKQPDLLIRVWTSLQPAGWRLVIAGPGDASYRAELQALIAALPDSHIELRDAVYGDDKTRLLSESALFVLPTHSENFGIAIAEALAHELPVITTTGTPWQAVAERGGGWFIPPTADALTKTLRQACALSPETLAARGKQARELAREYSWERTALALQNLFREIAGATS